MPAEDERELIGHVLLVGNRELCAVAGYVPDDAAQRCRPAFHVDVSEIVNLMARTFAQLAKRIAWLKQAHLHLLSCRIGMRSREWAQPVNDSARRRLNLHRFTLRPRRNAARGSGLRRI